MPCNVGEAECVLKSIHYPNYFKMQSILKPITALSVAGALMLQTSPTHAADPAKTSFEEVSVKLDPNGHLYAYMNTAKVMKQMDQMVESLLKMAKEGGDDSILNNPLFGPMISNLMEAIKPAYDESGVSQISGVGMSSFAVKEDLWRSKMYVHRSSQEGDGLIWKMLGRFGAGTRRYWYHCSLRPRH